MALPATALSSLRTRYSNHENYPENLRSAINLYLSYLETYKNRLANSSENLFTPSPANIQVPIKDVSPTALPAGNFSWPVDSYKNIHDVAKLVEYLGINELVNPTTFSRRDPFSRCMYVASCLYYTALIYQMSVCKP